ncbi:MAG: hypothetical protein WD063_05850 [Pirellulales bacterium]
MRFHTVARLCLTVCLVPPGMAAAGSPGLAPLVQTLRNVQPEGKGHLAATSAWAELTEQAGVDDLPTILAGMDGASPLAANWLRAAVDTIAERHLHVNGTLPTQGLEEFLGQKKHNPRARRLAFEWIARVDPAAPLRLIPGMLDDPSLELRRDAVARLLTAAEKSLAEKNEREALATYRKALVSARDLDQVKIITEALQKLGQPVDLAHHYGFVQDWMLIGPFDNHGGKGFDKIYPPEEAVDFAAACSTPGGTLRWTRHHTDDDYGAVDLNKAVGKHMGAAGYAAAEFQSVARRPIELRLGSENAVKIWLNGKLLASTEAYHSNSAMDQYIGRGQLEPGRNVILVKVCQNEMTVDWAQNWTFQLRASDSIGKAVLSTDRPPPKSGADQTAAKANKE